MENLTSYTNIALRQRQQKGWACYPHQNNFTKIKNTLTELQWLGSAALYAELVFFTKYLLNISSDDVFHTEQC